MKTHAPFYCLIPGSFRPPHQGHYEMISHYQSLASEAGGKVIVLVSKPSKKNERLTGSGQVITPQFVKERFWWHLSLWYSREQLNGACKAEIFCSFKFYIYMLLLKKK